MAAPYIIICHKHFALKIAFGWCTHANRFISKTYPFWGGCWLPCIRHNIAISKSNPRCHVIDSISFCKSLSFILMHSINKYSSILLSQNRLFIIILTYWTALNCNIEKSWKDVCLNELYIYIVYNVYYYNVINIIPTQILFCIINTIRN